MLDPELLARLRSDEGRLLLEAAAALGPDPFAVQKLRGQADFELAAAAVEQVRLRLSARAKFADADRMWFSQSLLEQSSGEVVSRHRAARFEPWKRVGDLCCGLGGDTLGIAGVAHVTSVDRDPLARALTLANAETLDLASSVSVQTGELPGDAPSVHAAWIDPGRREGGRRTRSVAAMSPSLPEVLSLLDRIPHLGIKLSPASPEDELDHILAGIPHEREVISLRGECKEMVLWLGDLAGGAPRRASLLPSGDSLSGSPIPLPSVSSPTGYLMEPDAAVIRAGLVGNLAQELDAGPLDAALAYLWVPGPQVSPFGRVYKVGEPQPFSLRELGERLRRLEASDVVIKTRGFAADPAALRQGVRRVLKQGLPGRCPVVFVTRVCGRAVMLLGERLGSTDAE